MVKGTRSSRSVSSSKKDEKNLDSTVSNPGNGILGDEGKQKRKTRQRSETPQRGRKMETRNKRTNVESPRVNTKKKRMEQVAQFEEDVDQVVMTVNSNRGEFGSDTENTESNSSSTEESDSADDSQEEKN